MITASHKKRWVIFFRIYASWHLKRLFHDMRYHVLDNDIDIAKESPGRAHNGSILVVSNHFSFWDGFIHMLFVHKIFKKNIFIMMLEEQLKKHPFLRYGGCFSVHRGKRDVAESLRYSCEILENPANALLIFPQGEVESLYTNDFSFMKGAGYIMDHSAACQVWMNVNLINYYSLKKPVLNIYLKRYHGEAGLLQESFNLFARECRKRESPEITGEKLL